MNYSTGPAVLAGHQRGPAFPDRAEEILDLQPVVIGGGVHRGEARAVLHLEGGEKMFLARDGPDGVPKRLADARHAGNEGRAAVGLHASRGAARSMDVDLRINAWHLRDRTEAPLFTLIIRKRFRRKGHA